MLKQFIVFKLLVILCLLAKPLRAQVETFGPMKWLEEDKMRSAKNSLYLELLGSAGGVYNITYDRIVFNAKRHGISLALGTQYWPGFDDSSGPAFTCSPQLNYFYGRVHSLELGAGLLLGTQTEEVVPSFRIGYRFQPMSGGPFFKLALTPLYIDTDSWPILNMGRVLIPWAGVAFGYTF